MGVYLTRRRSASVGTAGRGPVTAVKCGSRSRARDGSQARSGTPCAAIHCRRTACAATIVLDAAWSSDRTLQRLATSSLPVARRRTVPGTSRLPRTSFPREDADRRSAGSPCRAASTKERAHTAATNCTMKDASSRTSPGDFTSATLLAWKSQSRSVLSPRRGLTVRRPPR